MVDQQNSPDNHSDWSYPAPGYDDPSPTWGEILNALIEDDLDRAVVIKDTYANRPAAGEQGRWFLATDRKIVFYDDGAAWEAVAGKGTQANPVPGTTYLEELSTDGVDYNGLTPDYPHYQFDHTKENSDQTTTSTSYTDVLSYMGVFFPGDIPQNSTLYGRFAARIKNDTSNETTSVQPRVFDEGPSGWQNLAALELSATSTSLTFVDSGWTDISADIPNPGNLHRIPRIQMKVTAGTGTVGYNNTVLYLAGSVQ